MKNKIFFLFLFVIFNFSLFGKYLTYSDDYIVHKTENFEIIYTKQHQKYAKFLSHNLDKILENFDKSYGYKMQRPIIINLLSPKNKIANAFSTQYPANIISIFSGNADMASYFNNYSWLELTLIHELSHNYQLNAKKGISKTLHKVFGNNYFPIFVGAIPIFTIPNIMLPSVLLEGNAVMNESIHGEGRLNNGRLMALKNSMLLLDDYDSSDLINPTLAFPYGENTYIMGGFFMQYLSGLYGLEKVNSFFIAHAKHNINPLLVNSTFKSHFGDELEKSIENFIEYEKNKNKNFKSSVTHKHIATSQTVPILNKQKQIISFLTSDAKSFLTLNNYDIYHNKFVQNDTTLKNGKVFKIKNKTYTQRTQQLHMDTYATGLYDGYGEIMPHTKNKVMLDIGYDSNLSINVNTSLDKIQLYKNDKYYDDINAKALFDNKQNIYYFKPFGSKKVMYKNKRRIFTVSTNHIRLVDIVDNSIYFIANTKYGSTLYKNYRGRTYRLSPYDDIIDAKIIDRNNFIGVAISNDKYTVSKMKITNNRSVPYYKKSSEKLVKFDYNYQKIDTKEDQKYNTLNQMSFASLYPMYYSDSINGSTGLLSINFQDKLSFNALSVVLKSNSINTKKEAAIKYSNNTYNVPFNLNIFYSQNLNEDDNQSREVYGNFNIKKYLSYKDRSTSSLSYSYHLNKDNKLKKPHTLSFDYEKYIAFSREKMKNYSSKIKFDYQIDRDNEITSASYFLIKSLSKETYLELNFMKNSSKILDSEQDKGIKVVSNSNSFNTNKIDVSIRSSDSDIYVKDITRQQIKLTKIINSELLFYYFPISLQKTKLFIQNTNFSFDDVNNEKQDISESSIGLAADVLLFNKFTIPMQVEYIKNSYYENKDKTIFSLGITF